MEFNGSNKRVVFFDSGIGGLTLFMKCAKLLPECDLYYFADNFNVPYGRLKQERITELADQAFKKMSYLEPAAAVIACNTVTAVSAGYLRSKYGFPIIGIQPAVKPAVSACGSCAVLATPATSSSASLKALMEKYGGGRCRSVACPELATYIEKNITNLKSEEVVSLLPEINADSVVLGCTHYAFVRDIIADRYKKPVFDGLDGTADRVVSIVGKSDHLPDKNGKIYFIGGDEDKNKSVFCHFYGTKRP